MMKILLVSAFTLATIGAAAAQSSAPRSMDRDSTMQTMPSSRPTAPDVTGTMPDKNSGPAATTGTSRGPDGTPGNGSPSKYNGNQQ